MNRHRNDLFYLQVTLGPGFGNSQRADAVAIHPSWTKPCTTIYEIKTSISDLRGDEKWTGYLPYCNRFYFACPTGMVSPAEIPDPAGLIVVGPKGCRALKKPVVAPTEVPIDPVLYGILLHHYADDKVSERGLSSLRRWLENKEMYEDMGRRVGAKFREIIMEMEGRERVVEQREHAVEKVVEDRKRMEEILEPLGYPYRFFWSERLSELVALRVILDKVAGFADEAEPIKQALGKLLEIRDEIKAAEERARERE